MKKITLAAASIAALASVPAFAADLGRPITKAPAMVAPAPVAYNMGWTGFYIGGQVGYQYGYFRETDFNAAGIANGFGGTYNPDGIVGGGHAGFNFQTGAVVFGIEGDIEGSGVRGTLNFGANGATTFDQRWQSSVRGRLGFTVGPAALIYATGGAAFSDLRFNYTNGLGGVQNFNRTETGYTVGAGIEYKFAPNFSGRVEYRYTDFDSINNAFSNNLGNARQRVEFSTVRVGLSYYFGGFGGGFGGGAPVVAAY